MEFSFHTPGVQKPDSIKNIYLKEIIHSQKVYDIKGKDLLLLVQVFLCNMYELYIDSHGHKELESPSELKPIKINVSTPSNRQLEKVSMKSLWDESESEGNESKSPQSMIIFC